MKLLCTYGVRIKKCFYSCGNRGLLKIHSEKIVLWYISHILFLIGSGVFFPFLTQRDNLLIIMIDLK